MLEVTDNLEDAKSWAQTALGAKNAAKYYMSTSNLIIAYREFGSFSFLTQDEYIYSQLYGPNAYFDDRCDYLSSRDDEIDLSGKMQSGRGFQFWEVMTTETGSPIDILRDSAEINQLIDEHAPDSSVRPGDPEEVFWGGIRNEAQELIALGVIVKWQSGFHIMASVVTRIGDRGKGFATKLSAGMIAHAHSLGIQEIGLGVRSTNLSAQRAYEKAGFKALAEFTNYSRE